MLRVSLPAHLPAVHEFARDFAPDLVHVHHGLLWPVAADMAADMTSDRREAGALPLATAYTAHVLQRYQDTLRGLSHPTLSTQAEERALAEAHAVMAPSQAVAAYLLETAGVSQERLHIAALGIDDNATARAAAGMDAGGGNARERGPVVYVGRFSDINGVADLLAAVPAIARAYGGMEMVFAGGAPHNRKAAARWQRHIADALSEVPVRLSFPGWLDAAELSQLYARARMLVIPSWFETFGLVALEGMLHGVPIVATSGGALGELLSHGRTAVVVRPRAPEALSEGALSLLADPAYAARLSRAAAEHARRAYAWPSVMPALLSAYAAARQISAVFEHHR